MDLFAQGSHHDYATIPPEEMANWPQQLFIGGFRKYTV
jgi:hypothetical protein